jgi:xylulokinase
MEVAMAREMGRDPYDFFTDQAAKSPPGAAGLIYLPYIAAERSPIWDPCARGVLFGLTVAHRRSDVIRAIMEGVALSVHHNLVIMRESMGIQVDKLLVGGGCARSPVWNQIIADVIGHTLVTMRASETETLGAAVLAGVGTGVYESFEEARERTLSYEREFIPRPELASVYKAAFQIYRKLYRDLRPSFTEVAELIR